MTDDCSVELVSPELRASLLGYARRVDEALSELGVLSPMGRRVPRAFCQPLMLALHASDSPRYWGRDSGEEDSDPSDIVADDGDLVRLESQVLQEWLSIEHPEPLLISGGAGMGKSILLETFAHLLGRRLSRELGPESGPWRICGVPVLVPLRRMPLHGMALRETLLGGGALLLDPGNASPALSLDQLDWLAEHDLLIPLLDGFDELSPLQRARLIDSTAGFNRFLLTSRPDHGAEKWFPRDRVVRLTALSPDECREYVREAFSPARRVPGTQAMTWLDEALDGAWGAALTEPLFLRLWCDYIELHARPPTRRSILTDHMFEELLERRDVLGRRATATPSVDHVLGARRWLERYVGELGVTFVKHGFEPLNFEHPEVAAAGLRIGAYRAGEQPDGLAALERAGLLVADLSAATVQLLKLPIVESLIGKHLARSTLEPDGPRWFVTLFRRWVWLPITHRILTESFAELRQGTPEQVRLASACCEWLLSVSERCPLNDVGLEALAATGPVVQDDLSHPFAPLALQLAGDDQVERALRATIATRVKANWRHEGCVLPILYRIGPRHHLRAMVDLSKAHRDKRNAPIESPLSSSITRLASEVPPSMAFQAMCFGLSTWAEEPEGVPQLTYMNVVSASASRLHPADAVRAVPELVTRLNCIAADSYGYSRLQEALVAAICRAPASAVVELARTLITQLGTESTDRDDAVAKAVIAAATSVAPRDAPAFVDMLVDATACGKGHWRSLDDLYAHWLIAEHAIDAATARVLPQDAGAAATNWVRAFVTTGTGEHDPAVRTALARALAHMSGEVPSAMAVKLVTSLLESVRRLGLDCNMGYGPEKLPDALTRISTAVSGAEAVEAVNRWCRGFTYARTPYEKTFPPATRSAVIGAASQVPSNGCLEAIASWAEALRSAPARSNQSLRLAIGWALTGAAPCLKSADVTDAVRHLMSSLAGESPDWECPVRDAVSTAIKRAAEQLNEDDSWTATKEWLAGMRQSPRPWEIAEAVLISARLLSPQYACEAAHTLLRAAADYVDLQGVTLCLARAIVEVAARAKPCDAIAFAEMMKAVAKDDWVGRGYGAASILGEALRRVSETIPAHDVKEYIGLLLNTWSLWPKGRSSGSADKEMAAAVATACRQLPLTQVRSALLQWIPILDDLADPTEPCQEPLSVDQDLASTDLADLLRQLEPKGTWNLNFVMRKSLYDAVTKRMAADKEDVTERAFCDEPAAPSLEDLCKDVKALRNAAPYLDVSEAHRLAEMLSLSGQHSEALRLVCVQPALTAVVVGDKDGRSFHYECRFRSDESLVLDPKLLCVPEFLRTLLRPEGADRAGYSRRRKDIASDAPSPPPLHPQGLLEEGDYLDLLRVLNCLARWMGPARRPELVAAVTQAFVTSYQNLGSGEPAQLVYYRVVRTLQASQNMIAPPPVARVPELLRSNHQRTLELLAILDKERRPPVPRGRRGKEGDAIAPANSNGPVTLDTVARGYKRACKTLHPEL